MCKKIFTKDDRGRFHPTAATLLHCYQILIEANIFHLISGDEIKMGKKGISF